MANTQKRQKNDFFTSTCEINCRLPELRPRTSHGMHRLEGDDLGNARVDLAQLLLQVLRVVVAEHGLLRAARSDPHDHRRMIPRVREDVASCKWDIINERKPCWETSEIISRDTKTWFQSDTLKLLGPNQTRNHYK